MIEGPRIPPVGTDISLQRGSLEVSGRIVWARKMQAGIEFDEPLTETMLWMQVNAPQHIQVVVVSANWEESSKESWRAHLISRACENAIFMAAANRVGEEPTRRFSGDSLLVGPTAELYTVLDEPIEGYAVATIDLDVVRNVREDRQLIQFREPLAYRAIVRNIKARQFRPLG